MYIYMYTYTYTYINLCANASDMYRKVLCVLAAVPQDKKILCV